MSGEPDSFNGVLKIFIFLLGITQPTSYPFIMQAGGGITHINPPTETRQALFSLCWVVLQEAETGKGMWSLHPIYTTHSVMATRRILKWRKSESFNINIC